MTTKYVDKEKIRQFMSEIGVNEYDIVDDDPDFPITVIFFDDNYRPGDEDDDYGLSPQRIKDVEVLLKKHADEATKQFGNVKVSVAYNFHNFYPDRHKDFPEGYVEVPYALNFEDLTP